MIAAMERVRQIYGYHGLRGIALRALNSVMKAYRRREYFNPSEEEPLLRRDPLALQDEYDALPSQPKISIVMPVCDPPLPFLKRALQSVANQIYQGWELLLVDDASESGEVVRLLQAFSAGEPRVKLVTLSERSGIAAASNRALEQASGEYLTMLDHDDLLYPFSLGEIAREVNESPKSQVLYTDEFTVDTDDHVIDLSRKGGWSPLYLRGFMYVGHLTVYERSLLQSIGGFREAYSGSQDYDLLLRASEQAESVRYLPKKLYCWRAHEGSVAKNVTGKRYAFDRALGALREALQRQGLGEDREVEHGPYPGTYRYRAKRLKSQLIQWSYRDEGGVVREGSLWSDLVPLIESESELIMLSHSSLEPPTEEELSLLEGCLFPDIDAVGVLFTLRGSRAAALGWEKSGSHFTPVSRGDSLAFGGEGHRFYIPTEASAVSARFCVVRRALLESLAEGRGAAPACAIHPGVRRREPVQRGGEFITS